MKPGSAHPSGVAPAPRGRRRMFQAFSNTQYRWLWAHTLLNASGRTLEQMSTGWAALEVTDSAFWVGMATGMRGIGMVSFSLVGGVIADRIDRRKLLVFIQGTRMLLGFALGVLFLTDRMELWHLLLGSLIQGLLMPMNLASRNTLTLDLVGREALLNAIAFNMAAFNLMRIISPTAGGLIITAVGTGGVFFMMGASDALGVVFLLLMGKPPRSVRRRESVWANLREGLGFAAHHRPIRSLLTFSFVMETFAFSYHAMLSVIARDVLEVGPTGLGYLMSAGGVGSLVGSLVMASLGNYRSKGRLLVLTAGMFGLCLVLFAYSPWFGLSLALLAVAGALSMAYGTSVDTLLQTLAPDAMRGRVMGLQALTVGMSPLGGLWAGAIASVSILGAPFAVGLGGAVAAVGALFMARGAHRLKEPEPVPVASGGPEPQPAQGNGS